MKEESSVLEIFQDPLLMLIALILLGTLWIIVPVEKPASAYDPTLLDVQKAVDRLKQEIFSFDDSINKLRSEIDRLSEEIHILETRKKEAEETGVRNRQEVQRLRQEIASVKVLIEARQKELKRLEKELEAAGREAVAAKKLMAVEKRIRELNEDIAGKEALLKSLEKKLSGLPAKAPDILTADEEQRLLIGQLEQRLAIEEKEIKKLETRKKGLDRDLKERSGIGSYSSEGVKGKREVSFEAVNNRLVLINEKNYDYETSYTVFGNLISTQSKLKRKDSAILEAIDIITRPDSEFQKALAKFSPQTHYAMFAVKSDSFEVFLKARAIAWEKSFAVGWLPWEGPITLGPPGTREVRQ